MKNRFTLGQLNEILLMLEEDNISLDKATKRFKGSVYILKQSLKDYPSLTEDFKAATDKLALKNRNNQRCIMSNYRR